MRMQWQDLLFAHWRQPIAPVSSLIPSGLILDTFAGAAWIGVVPFRMSNVAPRGLPAIPRLSRFPELNVRTYVTHGGRAGVWFFSLDAASWLTVRAARRFFHLPYYDATMSCSGETRIHYHSRRGRGKAPASFGAEYGPTGAEFTSSPGTLEHWLTERYCLYSTDRSGRLFRGEIDHGPWPLVPARAAFTENTMVDAMGLSLSGPPDSLLFARRLDVVAWSLVAA
jgi:uncharacterized protein